MRKPTRHGRMPMTHLLKYDFELANFLNSAEDTLKNKCNEIWGCVQSLLKAMNCSPQTSLSLVLKILHWLPSIPWYLSYHMGIPTMYAYSPELYELQTWGATGDGGFHLDNHAQATNLLSHAGAYLWWGQLWQSQPQWSNFTHWLSSPTFINILTSQIPLQDSTSQDQPGKVPLPLSVQHQFPCSCAKITSRSKSTSQDGDGTDDKSVAGSDDRSPWR